MDIPVGGKDIRDIAPAELLDEFLAMGIEKIALTADRENLTFPEWQDLLVRLKEVKREGK